MGGRVGAKENVAFRAARERLNLSQEELAEALQGVGWHSCDRRTVQRYESGEVTRPRPFARRALSTVFQMPLSELGFPDSETVVHVDAASSPGDHPGVEPDEVHRRRELLQALAVLGASTPSVEALQTIRSSLDDVIGARDARDVCEWEDVVADYGYSYVFLPPGDLLRDLAADLVAVRHAMSGGASVDRRDWSRVLAGLAMLMAKTLSNLGRPREARAWWFTAERACDLCGDTVLALWVSAERLFHGMYDNRSPHSLLRDADRIAARCPDSPSRGLAPVRTGRAQVLATIGRGPEAVAELHRAQQIFDQLPSEITNGVDSIAFWGIDRLHYTETWIHAHVGNSVDVQRAAAAAHAAIPAGQSRAHGQLHLLQALGHARSGDVASALDLAVESFAAVPAGQRTSMVTTLAGRVLEALPARIAGGSQGGALRELLAAPPAGQ